MIVHCCHCTWCQRESGASFALNAMIETTQLEVTGAPELVVTPSFSGRGQKVYRCRRCRVALYSHYSHDAFAYVRVGTMDRPAECPPDVHIFTSTKQPWVQLSGKIFDEFYNPAEIWSEETRARHQAAKASR